MSSENISSSSASNQITIGQNSIKSYYSHAKQGALLKQDLYMISLALFPPDLHIFPSVSRHIWFLSSFRKITALSPEMPICSAINREVGRVPLLLSLHPNFTN